MNDPGECCLHGICLPVNFEDVGSLISYALLSDKAKEQMASQWNTLGGRCAWNWTGGDGGAKKGGPREGGLLKGFIVVLKAKRSFSA